MKQLITINKNFINLILIFLIISFILLFFIFQLKIERVFLGLINIDEDREITMIIDSSDTYFLNENKTISFSLNDKLYVINDVELVRLENNKFSIKIDNYELKKILQPNSSIQVNINSGNKKLYKLFFQD